MKRIGPRDAMKTLCCAGLLLALGCATSGPYDVAQDFEGKNKKTIFQLEEGSGGAVVVENGSGQLLCEVRPQEVGVSVWGSHGEALGSVVPLADRPGFAVRDATGRELYKLLVEADGDFKLRNAEGRNLYVGKKRDYGIKVLNAADEVESRIKIRKHRVSIRDRKDKKYLSAKVENPEPIAMAVLTLQEIPFSYAAGLSVVLTQAQQVRDEQAPEGAPES